jgi:acyl-CoA dehydrogenase
VAAQATVERAVELTGRYVKERTAFGKPLLDLQHTRFVLADALTDARVGRAFVDDCVARHLAGALDPVTAAMAKYWVTTAESRVLDACLQLHGGYGYMREYPIARMWADARYHRIGGGTSEIMRELIGWSV